MAIYKRRHYFIENKLQTKYIVLTILLLVVYTLLFVSILFLPYIIPLSFDYPVEEQTRAARMLLNLHATIWPALGAVIVIMSVLSIFITHKLAGPVYRFKKVLADVAAGNLDLSIRLRDKDDLKDLAEQINSIISEMRLLVGSLRGSQGTVSGCIRELEERISSKQIGSDLGEHLLAKLQTGRDEINQILLKYSKQG